MSLVRGASITFGARLTALVVGIASSVIIARALGPAGKGEYTLIVLIPTFLQFLGGFGLEHAITYRVARERERARGIAWTILGTATGLGIALVLLYGLLTLLPPYQAFLARTEIDPLLIWALVGLTPITLAYQGVNAAVLGLEWYRGYNLAALAAPLVNLAALVGLVIVLDGGIVGAVIATALATLAGLAFAAAVFFPRAPGELRRIPGLVREAIAYGIRVHVANVAWFIHYRADMFLVGFMAGPAALGFYATAVGLAEKLYLAPSAVGTVLFPRIAAAEEVTARDLTPRACRHTFWLTLALGIVLALAARPLIAALFGVRFLPAAAPLWLLIPGVVSLAVGRLLSSDLNGRGLPGTVARANVSMAILNLALNLWWIPIWGILGAAAATSLSYSAAVILLTRRYLRASGVPAAALFRLDSADRAAIAAALGRGRSTRRAPGVES